jgi:hypothetical protein
VFFGWARLTKTAGGTPAPQIHTSMFTPISIYLGAKNT